MPAAANGVRARLAEHRWWLCVAVGFGLYWLFPGVWGVANRSAVAWISGAAVFVGWTAIDLARAQPERLRALARREDPKRVIILGFTLAAATTSLFAATVLLPKGGASISRIVLVAGVVAAAWLLTHTMFALHYAHGFYGDGPRAGTEDDRGGLLFPGERGHPDFFDFVYFALVIGMTCQVSDVQITGPHMRRLASVHGVLAFFFNTVILAITVNLAVNAM